MTLQENTTIRTKIGAGIATPAEVAALAQGIDTPVPAERIAREAERDRASTDLVTMADIQTAIDASQWGMWL